MHLQRRGFKPRRIELFHVHVFMCYVVMFTTVNHQSSDCIETQYGCDGNDGYLIIYSLRLFIPETTTTLQTTTLGESLHANPHWVQVWKRV